MEKTLLKRSGKSKIWLFNIKRNKNIAIIHILCSPDSLLNGFEPKSNHFDAEVYKIILILWARSLSGTLYEKFALIFYYMIFCGFSIMLWWSRLPLTTSSWTRSTHAGYSIPYTWTTKNRRHFEYSCTEYDVDPSNTQMPRHQGSVENPRITGV